MLPVINAEFAAWWIFDDELRGIFNSDCLVRVNSNASLASALASSLGFAAVAWDKKLEKYLHNWFTNNQFYVIL